MAGGTQSPPRSHPRYRSEVTMACECREPGVARMPDVVEDGRRRLQESAR